MERVRLVSISGIAQGILLLLPVFCHAQFVANVTSPEVIGDSTFLTLSVSCYGDVCSAETLVQIDDPPQVKLLVRRSFDGGHTWSSQDPGLPDQHAATGNRFTRILQIDQANSIVIGDTALVMRSFDSGKTWERQFLHGASVQLEDVSFSDANNGIIVSPTQIYITHDAGRHWLLSDFRPSGLTSCHAYAEGCFRVMQYGLGVTYGTLDDWHSVDSTGPAVISSQTFGRVLARAYFDGLDTILAIGSTLLPSYSGGPTRGFGLIVRSSDAGRSWSIVHEDTTLITGAVTGLSNVSFDTIYAGRSLSFSRMLYSVDHGATWSVDTVVFQPEPARQTFSRVAAWDVDRNTRGEFVGVIGYFSTALMVGRRSTSGVESYRNLRYYSYLYPNPATTQLFIVSEDKNQPVLLYDMLGREVLRASLNEKGVCNIRLAGIPGGVYVAMIKHGLSLYPVSRVSVLGQ